MILHKKTAIVLISLLFALLLSVALDASMAKADDKESHPRPTAGSSLPPRQHHGDDDDKSEHDQLREQYGDNDIDQVFLPPLVVSDPGSLLNTSGAGARPAIKAPIGQPPVGSNLVDANNIDPHANAPIDVNGIKADKQTPAQEFFEIATVALVAMGAGSAALGGIAIRRAVKLRKTANSDFIYE